MSNPVTRSTHRWFVAMLCVSALSLAACSSSSSSSTTTSGSGTATTAAANGPIGATVTLKNIQFNPNVVTIKAGQAVKWTWEDAPTEHNVQFSNFESPLQATGTYVHTFTTPGTYNYVCEIHANMTAKVIVQPA